MSLSAPVPRRSRAAVRALACLATAGLAFATCLLHPLVPQGADTVPGRMGALALACAGTFDLRTLDWIAAAPANQPLPFYLFRTAGGRIVSPWGPGPAVVGLPAMATLERGTLVGDEELRRRARYGAAGAIALAAALLCLALLARRRPAIAIAGGLVAALSCAGAVSLGQALWQQTASLPILLAAVAALAWSDRRPAWHLAVPFALALAVTLRPPLVGLALGLAAAALPALRRKSGGPGLVVAAGLAFVGLLPVALWNQQFYGSPLPIGHASSNHLLAQTLLGGAGLWSLAPATLLARALAALASPARGLLWWAPVVVLALVRAVRAPGLRARAVGAGLLLHGLAIVAFFNWWGGVSFGPRLFAEAVWVSIWFVLGGRDAADDAILSPRPRGRRLATGVALAWTVAIGGLGLLRYDARAWELRREPIHDPTAVWDFRDNPLGALLTARDLGPEMWDAPPGPFRYCAPRPWTDLAP